MRVLHISPGPAADETPALAALEFLPHTLHFCSIDHADLMRAPQADVAVYDATTNLSLAPSMAERLATIGIDAPLVVVLTEGGLAAANSAWKAADIILAGAGPAEVDARLRLARTHVTQVEEEDGPTVVGALVIDENSYTATVAGKQLDLTYKEFELLKFLAQHPGRVFTRAQLLQDVWGYDYYGGTRTVDVHIRRLRAKLGPELEATIHTVRNVGYRFSPADPEAQEDETGDDTD
ncbi:winged helix-turn-helix domain-containing protein [Brevibacterium litoralis]|uniref:winged helix-turn-helix domain-containing protein n=1 Tax=Brevibacterium litoralis TaxID=3138935 RepID=UPI0032F0606A